MPDFAFNANGAVTFIVQNDAAGPCALSNNQTGSGFEGIDQSVGFLLRLNSTQIFTAVFRNGILGNTALVPFSPSDLTPLFVSIRYDGSFTTIRITDNINEPFQLTVLASPPFETYASKL